MWSAAIKGKLREQRKYLRHEKRKKRQAVELNGNDQNRRALRCLDKVKANLNEVFAQMRDAQDRVKWKS